MRPYGPVKILKKGVFSSSIIKIGHLWIVHKTRLERDHQTLTFDVIQLIHTTLAGGPTSL